MHHVRRTKRFPLETSLWLMNRLVVLLVEQFRQHRIVIDILTEGRLVGIALEDDPLQEINDVITTRQQTCVSGGGIITLSKPPIAVFVQVSLVHNQASHIPTSGFLPRGQAREPSVISMPQGMTLADRNVSAKKCGYLWATCHL